MSYDRLSRRQALVGLGTVAGGAAATLLSVDRAFALDSGPLEFTNDYAVAATVLLWGPGEETSRYWTFRTKESARLMINGQSFNVAGDWTIQVKLANGAQSTRQRLINVSEFSSGTRNSQASRVFQSKVTFGNKNDYILHIKGYTIDKAFGPEERSLLTDGLAFFYRRFLQDHWAFIPELETTARVKLADDFPRSNFKGASDEHDYLRWQFNSMRAAAYSSFPMVQLAYGYEKEGGWVARAHTTIIKPPTWGINDPGYVGHFIIEVNDYYVNNRHAGAQYVNPEYWAGAIAHEALHNLGHLHPPSRSDPDYYLHQMVLIEGLVMTNGSSRYGGQTQTPILCKPRPR
jgi:hypothetical protein